ncbi:MAG: twin-arginine translocase TatA/TatE family subunit [Chloroflexota bacterium]
MELFGVGIPEAGMILVILLLVVGPNRFPQVAREAGKWYRIARAYADEVMTDVRGAIDELEQEVGEPAGDLRSIRDIGSEIRSIGTETRNVASSTPPPASDSTDDSTRADGTR